MTSDKPRNEVLLQHILLALTSILLNESNGGIQSLLRGRVLSDVLSAAADLAFNSRQISDGERLNAQSIFDRIIAEYDPLSQARFERKSLRTIVGLPLLLYYPHFLHFYSQMRRHGSRL